MLGVSVQITAPMVETTSLSVPGNKTDYKIQIKSLQFSLFDEVDFIVNLFMIVDSWFLLHDLIDGFS